MRIVEKVLYGFGGLLALILLFIALCHYNPELAVKLGAAITVDAEEKTAPVPDRMALAANTTVTLGQLPAAKIPVRRRVNRTMRRKNSIFPERWQD